MRKGNPQSWGIPQIQEKIIFRKKHFLKIWYSVKTYSSTVYHQGLKKSFMIIIPTANIEIDF